MESGEVRILAIQKNNLNEDMARHLAKLFSGIARNPAKAREARGRFVLEFPDYDSDPRPNYAIPEIRRFVRTLDGDCQYAAYFLYGDPSISHIQFYLLCLVDPQNNERGQYNLRDLIAVAMERCKHVVAFCHQIGEDEDRGTEGLLMNLPPEALSGNAEASAKVLRAMKPALEALKKDFDNLVNRPDGRALIRGMLRRAAVLCGIDPGHRMDEALLGEILKRLR